MRHDVIVIGLGGVGSAAAWQLALRGQRVLGLESHGVAHDLGSSHGRSRITRRAYMEGAWYVPLVIRSEQLWRELEAAGSVPLLTMTGGLMIGRADSKVVAGALQSAAVHSLPHECLDAATIRARFPVLRPEGDVGGVYERDAGVLAPESCVAACLRAAAGAGAELRFDTRALDWEETASGVRVRTARGTHEAGALVVTAGPWASRLLPDLGVPLTVTREVMFWLPASEDDTTIAARMPIFMWDRHDEGPVLYGFPALDGPRGGVKVALHMAGTPADPDSVDRAIHGRDVEAIREAVRSRLPALQFPPLHAAVCLYTRSPDLHFLIGRYPASERVVMAAGLSGHGFKFASGIGEALAEIVVDGRCRLDLSPASPARFAT